MRRFFSVATHAGPCNSCQTTYFRKRSDVRSETRNGPHTAEILPGALGRPAQYRAVSGDGLAGEPRAALATIVLRLTRAVLPVVALWFGKLIIDEVIRLSALTPRPDTLTGWWQGGEIDWLLVLVLVEFGLAVLSDLLARLIGLVDTLLSEKLTMSSSIRLMDHAATLDLEDFEDSEFQDQLERARRQSSGRMTLMGQLFGQMQDLVTVATFAGGLLIYNPWLIVLLMVALIPAFLGEAHFSAQTYTLDFRRTPERRELDYVRQTAASVETAKEVKIFGLSRFLTDRYRTLSQSFYAANRSIAQKRALWGALFTGVGTVGYYLAYVWIIGRTLTGALTIGDLTFLAGSFRRLRNLLEGLLASFSSTAAQALYLDDLFDFFKVEPEILSPPNPAPLPRPIREGFVFENVGFRYPGAERWAVRHLNFTLKAGETLALVGENGAGKTTLVKLLARLYDPDEGRILLVQTTAGCHHDLLHHRLARAHGVDRIDGFVGAQADNALYPAGDRNVEDVLAAQHVSPHCLHGMKFTGRNLLERRRVKDIVDAAHDLHQAAFMAYVANVEFDLGITIVLVHIVLFFFHRG
jgi:ABC-type multidrug transport system fused ATPase/permease subunit